MFKVETLSTALWLLMGGAVLIILLGRCGLPAPFGKALAMLGPARRAGLALGRLIEQVDGEARQWPAAGLSLLVVAILLGAALMASSP